MGVSWEEQQEINRRGLAACFHILNKSSFEFERWFDDLPIYHRRALIFAARLNAGDLIVPTKHPKYRFAELTPVARRYLLDEVRKFREGMNKLPALLTDSMAEIDTFTQTIYDKNYLEQQNKEKAGAYEN